MNRDLAAVNIEVTTTPSDSGSLSSASGSVAAKRRKRIESVITMPTSALPAAKLAEPWVVGRKAMVPSFNAGDHVPGCRGPGSSAKGSRGANGSWSGNGWRGRAGRGAGTSRAWVGDGPGVGRGEPAGAADGSLYLCRLVCFFLTCLEMVILATPGTFYIIFTRGF